MTSRATKRKHVTKEVLDEFVLPQENQQIVKVVSSCGNNLHQVQASNSEKYLVSMPTKFRRNVWIKRGDYLLVESIEEGDKVKGEIISILYKEQIKYIQENNLWPEEFKDKHKSSDAMIDSDMLPPDFDSDSEREDSGGEARSVRNPNRHIVEADTNDFQYYAVILLIPGIS